MTVEKRPIIHASKVKPKTRQALNQAAQEVAKKAQEELQKSFNLSSGVSGDDKIQPSS